MLSQINFILSDNFLKATEPDRPSDTVTWGTQLCCYNCTATHSVILIMSIPWWVSVILCSSVIPSRKQGRRGSSLPFGAWSPNGREDHHCYLVLAHQMVVRINRTVWFLALKWPWMIFYTVAWSTKVKWQRRNHCDNHNNIIIKIVQWK